MMKNSFALTICIAALALSCANVLASPGDSSVSSYILQGQSVEKLVDTVEDVGGIVTHRISVIKAVGATLTTEQKLTIEAQGVRLLPGAHIGIYRAGYLLVP